MNTYYYLSADKEPHGPHTLDELRALLATGKLTEATMVSAPGSGNWISLATLLTTPQAMPTLPQQDAGPCPACSCKLATTLNLLPERCPQCGYRLRPQNPNSLWQNFLLALRKSFVLKGRATRIELWSFVLFSMILSFIFLTVLQIAAVILLPAEALFALDTPNYNDMPLFMTPEVKTALILISTLTIIFNIVLFVPQLSATIRRLHDVGRSGWHVVLYLAMCMVLPFCAGCIAGALSNPSTSPLIFIGIGVALSLTLIGYALYLFILLILDSHRGTNTYGVSPKYPIS
jgi:uncharacterized membrane protein YhaH (DUF805 family)